ncbi:MAG TPA: organomercurial lyase [Candidatus Dormibacteraeota bacterium]
MDESDIALRNLTYGQFRELGRAPTAEEVASASGSSVDDVRSAWRRLHDAHALVLNPGTTEIKMANPFSAAPTAYRVHAAGRHWYGNCAWDAFGILAALHVEGQVETSCLDCGEAISVEVVDERPNETNLVFHCLVPARQWWSDIAFT